MFCPKCNASIPDGSEFCPYCGEEKLEPKTEEAETSGTEETAETVKDSEVTKESSKAVSVAVIVVCVVAVIAAVVSAFFIGKNWSEKAKETTASTSAVTEPGETTTGDSTGKEPGETTDSSDVSNPDFEPFPDDYELVYPKGFDFLGTDFSEYIVLGDYKGLEVEIESATVTDEDVMEYIETYILPEYPTEKEITGRPAANGDIVYIDFSGSIDGVVFEGGTAANQRVVIGAGGFIDGFEEGIIGMNIGETKVVDCFFPENYHSEDLAGKTAQFEMTLHSIVMEESAEYSDLFVSENTPYESMEALEAYLKEALAAEKAQMVESSKTTKMLEAICANAEIKGLPDGLVEDYMYGDIMMYKQYAAMYEMEYGEFVTAAIGMTVEEFETGAREMSKSYIEQEFAIWAVVAAENIVATEEEVEAYIPEYLANLGFDSMEALIETSKATEEEIKEVVLKIVTEQKTIEFLLENTTFTVVE